MIHSDIFSALAEAVISRDCIAFIGAGASATYTHRPDDVHFGLPLAKDLLHSMQQDRSYCSECNTLSEASFMMKTYEGRPKLLRFLKEALERDKLSPLPCHKLLASIDFTCYVSMNFDELLEDALNESYKEHFAVLSDKDVSNLQTSQIPVIKPHGTLSVSDSMRIASDEVLNFEEHAPILNMFLGSQLANKTVLFVGFGLADYDFISLIRYLKKNLNDYMPKSYAIVKGENNFLEKFWSAHDVEIVNEDATTFLTQLQHVIRQREIANMGSNEPWMRNIFFSDFIEHPNTPTETQVIEKLISKIDHTINSHKYELSSMQEGIESAINLALKFRPNFSALASTGESIREIFDNYQKQGKSLEDGIRELQTKYALIREGIQNNAYPYLEATKNILLYSQSQRVIDVLLSLPDEQQKGITVYIPECRPKSSEIFQEALATVRLLRKSSYKLTCIPDMTALKLLRNKSICIVLMGAHSVHSNEHNEYTTFINTCGTIAINESASSAGVSVYVIFEKEKIIYPDKSKTNISTEAECELTSSAVNRLSEEEDYKGRINIENHGYDIVPWTDNCVAITD